MIIKGQTTVSHEVHLSNNHTLKYDQTTVNMNTCKKNTFRKTRKIETSLLKDCAENSQRIS
jgi:hypothetical protein